MQYVEFSLLDEQVLTVEFTVAEIKLESHIKGLGDELFLLVDQNRNMILDFRRLQFLSSAAMGKLITLQKKLKERSLKLVLCNIRPAIYEMFSIMTIDKHFRIKESFDNALVDIKK